MDRSIIKNMPPKETFPYPFITRGMLDFEEAATFSLVLDTVTRLGYWANLTIQGATKRGVFKYTIETANTSAAQQFIFPISDMPIFLSVIQDPPSNIPDNVWIALKLAINKDVAVVLTQGYPHGRSSVSWPVQQQNNPIHERGQPSDRVITNPGAGAALTITVPTNENWELVALKFTYVANANVVTRRPGIRIEVGGVDIAKIPAAADITAGQTVQLTFMIGATYFNDTVGLRQTIPLPEKLLLIPTSIINSEITGFQAGDEIKNIYFMTNTFYI